MRLGSKLVSNFGSSDTDSNLRHPRLRRLAASAKEIPRKNDRAKFLPAAALTSRPLSAPGGGRSVNPKQASVPVREQDAADIKLQCRRNIKREAKPPSLYLVRVTGFEPAASCSQSRRATNCATPGCVFL